jgi:TolA-binding protein
MVQPRAPLGKIRTGRPAAPAPPDEDALYRAAHEAHFGRGDFADALVAWEHYLREAPHGSLAIEARYNRAIALYRLGRQVEAAGALKPFADGEYGSYQRDEAAALIERMSR